MGREPWRPGWRIRDSRKGRRGHFANELFESGCLGFCGVFWLVGFVVFAVFEPIDDVGDVVALFGALMGSVVGVSGGIVLTRTTLAEMRTREDLVWLDDADLWWIRRRPHEPGVEPTRVTRSEIVEVRLSGGDRAVVVRTEDGTDHTVTDVGTAADRITLAAAIKDRVAPRTGSIHPELPPDLPPYWTAGNGKGTSLIWRRPIPGRWWTIPLLGFLVIVDGPVLAANDSDAWRTPVVALILLALGGLVAWAVREVRLTRPAWLVHAGRLEAVRVKARQGDRVSTPCHVTDLELRGHPRTGYVRLDAVLDTEERLTVMSGWLYRRRMTGVARWLADRADVPLRHRDSDRDDVASGQVRR